MLRLAFRRNAEFHRRIGQVMVFALIFAAVHVALHDLNLYGDGLNGHHECQVCRLSEPSLKEK